MVGSLRWGFLLLVLTIALIAPPTDAFLTSLRTSSSTARVGRAIGPLRLRLAADTVRLSSSASDGATILQKRSTVKIDAQTLLRLLVQPRASAQSKDDPTLKIRSLITRLSEAQVAFDPAQCLNGPLYAVLHQQGPKVPRWEKIGRLLPNNTNIKGQQFVFRPDTQSFDIVNYAEVFGRGLFVRVEGTAKAAQEKGTGSQEKDTNVPQKPSFLAEISNFLEPLLVANTEQKPQSKSLTFQCPFDIEATVNGGGLYTAIGQQQDDDDKKLLLDLPMIQGAGLVRVLYADPQLRIFLSPTQGDGGWEDQGLVVVQVRKDLLPWC